MGAFRTLNEHVWRDVTEQGLHGMLAWYILFVGCGCLLLLFHGLLKLFGFSERPGLGRHFLGPMGSHVFHDALDQLYPASVALMLGGVGGVVGHSYGWKEPVPVILAASVGIGGYVFVAWFFPYLRKLNARATLVRHVVGQIGLVAEAIPAMQAGEGIITLYYPERGTHYRAVSCGPEALPGAQVKVLAVLETGVLQVRPEVDYGKEWKMSRYGA